jgi:hypothetical protein
MANEPPQVIVWDDRVAEFVAARLGFPRGFGECRALGFLDKTGAIEAGCVYHNWNPEAGVIEISAAALHHRWGTKDKLQRIFHYPFETCGCQAVVARHREDNPVRRIWRALGASEHIIPRLRGRDASECIAVLPVEVWRASRFARR